MSLRAWRVRIRLAGEVGNKIAETSVACSALDPSMACVSAWAVMKHDVKGQKIPRVHVVQFLVTPDKEKK